MLDARNVIRNEAPGRKARVIASALRPGIVSKPFVLVFALLVLAFHLSACSQTRKAQFQALSSPMKCWVLLHPFAASRAEKITEKALAITDSVRQTGVVGSDFNGGALDAFRHGLWMGLLVRQFSSCKAASLGRAYERGNHWQFKHGKLEDNARQDAVARMMDLHNNRVGRAIGRAARRLTEADLQQSILDGIRRGDFMKIYKDKAGNSLDATGKVIGVTEWQGRWRNARQLCASNYVEAI